MFENEVLEVEECSPPEPSAALGILNVITDETKHLRITESKPGPKGRVKRTEAQMIASMNGSPMKESAYVLDRIAKLEDKISELMGAVSQKSREYILAERPELSKY